MIVCYSEPVNTFSSDAGRHRICKNPKEEEMKKALLILMVVTIGCFATFAQATAETAEFPTKTVTAVVGWNAGGEADIVFRALAEVFPKYANNQTMVIKNEGAAAGVPAITNFKNNTAADGYTLTHWNESGRAHV